MVQGEVEAEVEGSEGATVSRPPLLSPKAPGAEIRLADLVRRVSRLDGSGREAGDGEGTGEKDSRCSPDAAQVVAYHFAAGSCRVGCCWKRDRGQLSKGVTGQASRGKAAAHGVWFQIRTHIRRHRHRQSESVPPSNKRPASCT